jgi:hypothetical protein
VLAAATTARDSFTTAVWSTVLFSSVNKMEADCRAQVAEEMGTNVFAAGRYDADAVELWWKTKGVTRRRSWSLTNPTCINGFMPERVDINSREDGRKKALRNDSVQEEQHGKKSTMHSHAHKNLPRLAMVASVGPRLWPTYNVK